MAAIIFDLPLGSLWREYRRAFNSNKTKKVHYYFQLALQQKGPVLAILDAAI